MLTFNIFQGVSLLCPDLRSPFDNNMLRARALQARMRGRLVPGNAALAHSTAVSIPKHSRVAIIGGGVIGTSIGMIVLYRYFYFCFIDGRTHFL